MFDASTENKAPRFKIVMFRLLSKSRNKTITIEQSMAVPFKFEKFYEYKDVRYKFENHYENHYVKHHDVVYHEV